MILDWIQRYRLKRLIKQGLQIADDCRLISAISDLSLTSSASGRM